MPISSFGAHGEAQGGALAGNDTFIWSPLQFNNPRGSGSGKIGRYLRSARSVQYGCITLSLCLSRCLSCRLVSLSLYCTLMLSRAGTGVRDLIINGSFGAVERKVDVITGLLSFRNLLCDLH